MNNYKNKHRLSIKTIAMVVVCLFAINSLVLTNPAAGVSINRNTLATQSRFAALINEGIMPSFQIQFEILAGIRLLLAGKTYSAVNGMLIEKHGDGIERGESNIEFLSEVERSTEGSKVKARFIVKEKEDVVFEIEYVDTTTDEVAGRGKQPEDEIYMKDAGLQEHLPLEQLHWGNVFQQDDKVEIKRLPYPKEHINLEIWQSLAEKDLEKQICPICGARDCNVLAFNVINGIRLPVVKCAKDGMVFIAERPKSKWWDSLYNTPEYFASPIPGNQFGYPCDYEQSADRRSRDNQIRLNEVNQHSIKKGTWLDIGSSSGYILERAQSDGWEVIGVEPNEEKAKIGEQKGLRMIASAWEKAEIEQKSVDVVSLYDVIEHMTDLSLSLSKINKVLKDNGLFVLRTPDISNFTDEAIVKILGRHREHLFYFNRDTIEKLMQDYGFEIIEIVESGQQHEVKWMTVFARKKVEQQKKKQTDKLILTHNDEQYLLTRTSRHLKKHLVNMYIDLSNISKQQLEQNMETLALSITWYHKFGLNVRYILENDENGQAEEILKGKLIEDLASCVGSPYTAGETIEMQDGEKITVKKDELIDIRIENIEGIEKDREINDREYVVALREDRSKPGIAIPNYAAAAAMGLSLAALRVARDKLERQPETDTKMEYEQFRGKILDKFRDIYERYNVITNENDFSEDELELMVMGSSATKLYYTVLYALPPVVKVIEGIQKYHEMMQDLLIAA